MVGNVTGLSHNTDLKIKQHVSSLSSSFPHAGMLFTHGQTAAFEKYGLSRQIKSIRISVANTQCKPRLDGCRPQESRNDSQD